LEFDESLRQFVDQHPLVLGIIHRHDHKMDNAGGECPIQCCQNLVRRTDASRLAPVPLEYAAKSGLLKVRPKSSKCIAACFQQIIPYA
jgi:hypothetical protein